MKTIHEKIKTGESITKGDAIRVLNKIKSDVSIVKKDMEEKNPRAINHINDILAKIERTVLDETFITARRGKTLLDTNLKVTRSQLELGQQHKDIQDMKKKIEEVDTTDHNLLKILNSIVENTGGLIGITKGKKEGVSITPKQSRMLEIIDLDKTLKPHEQKILRYLVIERHDYKTDTFKPAYVNEIKRNSRIDQHAVKKTLNSLVGKGLLEILREKNKIYFFISPKFFPKEAHNVAKSIEDMTT